MYYFFSLLMSHICVRLSKRMGGVGGGSDNHNRICIGCYTMDRMNFEFLYKLLRLTMPYMYVRACPHKRIIIETTYTIIIIICESL